MKRHELLDWEYSQKDKLQTLLPIMNKIIYRVAKIDPEITKMYGTMAHINGLTFYRLTPEQRKLVCAAIRKETGVPIKLTKEIDEDYITYISEFDFKGYELRFKFHHDLPESCTVTYKTEYREADDGYFVGHDNQIYRKVNVVDEIVCGDKATLRSTTNG